MGKRAEREERNRRGVLEAARLRDDLFPAMSASTQTPPASLTGGQLIGSRLLGFCLVAASLGFTSLLVFVRVVAGLFR